MDEKKLENVLKFNRHLLSNSDLRRADLSYADLTGADLTGADLTYANLRRADLRGADLRAADLRGADLRCADLSYADLRAADLTGAVLTGAVLRGAKNVPFIPFVCPDFGSFIGFKKAKDKVVALEIPEDAKRCSATTRKCRCNKAKVLGIYDVNHNLLNDTIVASNRDNNFLYIVGETVSVDNFDEDRWNECSTGIRFFINFEEAARY